MTQWIVYIVECDDKSLYTGITTDVQKRIEKHNSGKGAKYTRSRRPVKLQAYVNVNSKSEALKLEASVKKHKKCDKLKALKDYDANNKKVSKNETHLRFEASKG